MYSIATSDRQYDSLRRQIAATVAPLPASPVTLVTPAAADPCYVLTGRETTLDAILEISAGLPTDTMEGCRISGTGGLLRTHINSIALTRGAMVRIWKECVVRQMNVLRYLTEGTAPDGSYQEFLSLCAVRRLLDAAFGLSQPLQGRQQGKSFLRPIR